MKFIPLTFSYPNNNKTYLEKVKKNTNPQLQPVRDIDGHIQTFSPKMIYVDSTPYEDCFERMSFEKENMGDDFWRDDELYDSQLDYRTSLNEKYSYDDIAIADIEAHKIYGVTIPNIHYPETDISENSKRALTLLNFTENLVPSTLENKSEITYEELRNLASEATNQWDMGMPTTQIIRNLDKSKLMQSYGKKCNPDIDLFKFLFKYPNARHIAVIKISDNSEILDSVAIRYYPLFASKLFNDEKTAKAVLDECKTTDEFGFKSVNSDLCKIVSLLRHKSAQGIQNENPFTESNDYRFETVFCDKKEPWHSKDTELIKKLKKADGSLDINTYLTVYNMLKNDKQTVDYVLENFEENKKYQIALNKIEKDLQDKYNENFESQKILIKELLHEEYAKCRKSGSFGRDKTIRMDITKCMIEGKYPINDIIAFLKMLNKVEQKEIVNSKFTNKLLKLCTIKNRNENPQINKNIILFVDYLYEKNRPVRKEEEKLIDILKSKVEASNDFRYTMRTLIGMELEPRTIVENIDEYLKYNKRTMLFNKSQNYKDHFVFISGLLNTELFRMCQKPDFKVENCPILKEVEKLAEDKITYFQFLENVQEIKAQNVTVQ